VVAVVTKSYILWDLTACISLTVNDFSEELSHPTSGSKNKPKEKPA
jgi:hypothetical protein